MGMARGGTGSPSGRPTKNKRDDEKRGRYFVCGRLYQIEYYLAALSLRKGAFLYEGGISGAQINSNKLTAITAMPEIRP